jgi:cell division septation protein DedD
MAANDFQNDFFDEQGRGQKDRKNTFLPDQRYLPQVRVPIEYTIVIAIGMLIAIIVAYAVGVERGKRVAFDTPEGAGSKRAAVLEEEKPLLDVALVEKQAAELMKKTDAPPEPVNAAAETSVGQEKTQLNEKVVAGKTAATASPAEVLVDTTVYTLQLASTKNEEYAKIEVEKLKAKGVVALIAKKGDWFKIYLPCSSQQEAEKAKKDLGTAYKDCLILRSKPAR